MRVIIKSRHIVKPAEPTWQGSLRLSDLDQVTVITHSSVLYLYNKPEITNNKICNTNTLKESLSRALAAYYPLAGRLRHVDGGRFELECNAEGGVLVEAESSMRVADFGDLYFDRRRLGELFVGMNYYETPIEQIPLVAIQITRFACGGISVGASVSHIAADGVSGFRVLKYWAMLHGIYNNSFNLVPFLPPPSFDRTPLIMLAAAAADDDDDDDERLLTKDGGGPLMLADNHADGVPNYFKQLRLSGQSDWGKLVAPAIVLLTKNMIQRLRHEAATTAAEPEPGHHLQGRPCRPYTRFEVIAAHVWRCACIARELNNQDITELEVPVSVRERMEPPYPSFFGNGVIEAGIRSSVGELLSKPLSYACRLIREGIQNVNNEKIIERMKYLKKQTSLSKYQYIDDLGIMEGPRNGDNDISIVSWLNLAIDGLEFGWGREIRMVPSFVQARDGEIQLSPYGNDSSVAVDACLQPKEKFVKCMLSF